MIVGVAVPMRARVFVESVSLFFTTPAMTEASLVAEYLGAWSCW